MRFAFLSELQMALNRAYAQVSPRRVSTDRSAGSATTHSLCSGQQSYVLCGVMSRYLHRQVKSNTSNMP
jgi:hypothetical protein